jgi:aminopeptidase N
MRAMLSDESLDDLMRGELLQLPTHTFIAERMAVSDPGLVEAEREGLKAWLGASWASCCARRMTGPARCPLP